MSSELLEWAHTYLEQDEEIVVPIKKMWNDEIMALAEQLRQHLREAGLEPDDPEVA